MKVDADAPWKDRMWEGPFFIVFLLYWFGTRTSVSHHSITPLNTVVTTFWSLGLIAFGGPAAHVAILREHLVVRRDWISEEQFMELFAIGQVRAYL
jgi:Chromate transporter